MKSNSLTQYIELYEANRKTLEQHSSAILNSHREAALEVLRTTQLPEKGDEGFEKTSINDMFAPDYGLNINGIDLPVNPAEAFRCGVPNMSTRMAVVANDIFHPTQGLQERLPDGVIFCSLREATEKFPEITAKYYGTVAPLDNAAVALNTLLIQQGVFLYIPDGVLLDKPLQLVNLFRSPEPLMAVRRVLIVVGCGASGQLLVCDHSSGSTNYLSSQVVEIIVDENAEFDYYDIEEATPSTSRLSQTFVRQCTGSKITVNGTSLSGGTTRNDWVIDVTGQRCETLLAGMAVAIGNQHVDNYSALRHLSSHSHSRQLFKYVLDDHATGAFEGGILVTPDAPFTEAYQSNRNVLASTNARMHTKPQLEIYNDEVKCSHGATTGQLDREALFYMQTRGIPEREARTMLMQAFMTDVIDSVKLEPLRDRLTRLVDRRFHSCEATCADCEHTLN